MFAEPLNGTKDARPQARSIAGHFFDFHTHLCSCNKLYSDVSAAPESAISDNTQSGIWCHQGVLTRHEWAQIRDENDRIFACCKS